MSAHARLPKGPSEKVNAQQRCAQCGCDDLHACRLPNGDPCRWTLEDLCSNPKCLAADPRTPQLAFDGDTQMPLLVRPIDPARIPPRGAANVRRAEVPVPESLLAALYRVPLLWLMTVAFLDPSVRAIEVHPWAARGGVAVTKAVRRMPRPEFRMVSRTGRFFVIREPGRAGGLSPKGTHAKNE